MSVIAVAYVVMMAMVWLGLRLRTKLGTFRSSVRLPSRRAIVVSVLQSLVVFVAAVAAFADRAIVMANIVGMPEKADVSGYDFLRGTLPMLVLSLVVIYVVSAFGEEVIFRGFLINRFAGCAPAAKRRGGWPLCLSAIVFGLCHYAGTGRNCADRLYGVGPCASYLFVRRNLWVTILTHEYMDTILVVPIYFSGT